MRIGWMLACPALLLALAPGAWAEPPLPPRSLPPISRAALSAASFDVRAFDPFGMPDRAARQAVAVTTPRPDLPAAQRVQEAHANASPGLFSDGWRRDGFGSLR
jgi:hypothetical protein